MKTAKLKNMASVALLMALVVIMQFISGLIPPISGISLSLVLIPVVLGAILYGPAAGTILGCTFGVITYINCVTGTDVGGAMVFQSNPLLCFLVVMGKGILAGLASGWVYRMICKNNLKIATLCAAIVCPTVNTGVFLACMIAFFKDVLAAWANGGEIVVYVLSALVLFNFIPELLINIIFSFPFMRIVRIVNGKK